MKLMTNAQYQAALVDTLRYATEIILRTRTSLPKSSIEKRNLLAQVAAEIDPSVIVDQVPPRRRKPDTRVSREEMYVVVDHD